MKFCCNQIKVGLQYVRHLYLTNSYIYLFNRTLNNLVKKLVFSYNIVDLISTCVIIFHSSILYTCITDSITKILVITTKMGIRSFQKMTLNCDLTRLHYILTTVKRVITKEIKQANVHIIRNKRYFHIFTNSSLMCA